MTQSKNQSIAQKEFFAMIKNLSYKKAKNETEAFVLASGKRSMHYFDLKRTLLHPQGYTLMGQVLWQFISDRGLFQGAQGFGGLTLGADPLSYALASQSQINGNPMFPLIVRKEEKGHGAKRRIEGYVEQCSKIIALDDVVTTGGSTINAIEAFRAAGLVVQEAVAIINRNEGGQEALSRIGVTLHSLFQVTDFYD